MQCLNLFFVSIQTKVAQPKFCDFLKPRVFERCENSVHSVIGGPILTRSHILTVLSHWMRCYAVYCGVMRRHTSARPRTAPRLTVQKRISVYNLWKTIYVFLTIAIKWRACATICYAGLFVLGASKKRVHIHARNCLIRPISRVAFIMHAHV